MPRGGARPNSGPKAGEPRKKAPGLPLLIHRVTSRDALIELAREYSGEAVMTQVRLMRESESEVVRLNAASAIIDRGWGKVPQAIEAEGSGGIIVNIVKFGDFGEPDAIEHDDG